MASILTVAGENFLESNEFKIIDTKQPATMPVNLTIEQARPAIVIPHHNRYWQLIGQFDYFNMLEKFNEAPRIVVDAEFVQKIPVWQTNRDKVARIAEVNCNTN